MIMLLHHKLCFFFVQGLGHTHMKSQTLGAWEHSVRTPLLMPPMITGVKAETGPGLQECKAPLFHIPFYRTFSRWTYFDFSSLFFLVCAMCILLVGPKLSISLTQSCHVFLGQSPVVFNQPPITHWIDTYLSMYGLDQYMWNVGQHQSHLSTNNITTVFVSTNN